MQGVSGDASAPERTARLLSNYGPWSDRLATPTLFLARQMGRRPPADTIAARLAASEASGNSCTAAASKAASRAAVVLADVLKRAD